MGKQEHDHDSMKHDEGRKERKHGGRLEKKKEHRKRGGKVEGKKPEHRMDKRARGGRMTPASPLSGAGHTTGGVESDDEKKDGKSDEYDRASGGRLTASDRNALPASDFALPGRRYPIENSSHGKNALARVAQHGSPAEKARVRAAVHRKYPGIGAS